LSALIAVGCSGVDELAGDCSVLEEHEAKPIAARTMRFRFDFSVILPNEIGIVAS
jgi:hypothetical protein